MSQIYFEIPTSFNTGTPNMITADGFDFTKVNYRATWEHPNQTVDMYETNYCVHLQQK